MVILESHEVVLGTTMPITAVALIVIAARATLGSSTLGFVLLVASPGLLNPLLFYSFTLFRFPRARSAIHVMHSRTKHLGDSHRSQNDKYNVMQQGRSISEILPYVRMTDIKSLRGGIS